MDSFGTDNRTYKRNIEAMMKLDLIHDGGAVWIIPHRVYEQIQLNYTEELKI